MHGLPAPADAIAMQPRTIGVRRIVGCWLVASMLIAAGGLGAMAGPWPREPGEGFVALSFTTSANGQDAVAGTTGTIGLWAEYGLNARNWLVIDAGRSASGAGSLALDLHRALGSPEAQLRTSASLGVGVRQIGQGRMVPELRLGASMGRGFSAPLPGWASLDLSARLQRQPDGRMKSGFKADTTLGVSVGARLKTIVQLQAAETDGNLSLYGAPSIVLEMRPGLDAEIGLRHPLHAPGPTELRMGTWFRF